MEMYTGFIRRIRFYNESNCFLIATFETDEMDEFTISGYLSEPSENEKYQIEGSFKIHPKYGEQFVLDKYEVIMNTDIQGIIKYLSSTVFKGVGKALATRIVEKLGENTLSMIVEDRTCLDDIQGMNEEKSTTIYETLSNLEIDQSIVKFLMGYGVSMKNVVLIQMKYQHKTISVLQNNPYQLIDDIDGIGFKTTDELALKLGIEKDHPSRIQAAIIYVIKQGCFQTGSTYVDYEYIEKNVFKMIGFNDPVLLLECVEELLQNQKVIKEEERFYDHDYHDGEMTIVDFIQRIQNTPKMIHEDCKIDELIEQLQQRTGIQYAIKQKEAIHTFMENACMIITGGPGTGKTTIVQALIRLYMDMYPHHSIALVAPTGRAAKRLSQLTNMKATTIHRLLKWDLHTNTYGMNGSNPLEHDVLIIDEASMIDTLLLANLAKASKNVYRILFIGDHNQLPSVSPGNVLKDLIEANVKTVELNEIFRQGKDSGIIQLASQINYDKNVDIEFFKQYDDIHFYPCFGEDVVTNIVTIVKKALAVGYDINDIQVLSPMYQGLGGIDRLNHALQDVYNPLIDQKTYQIGKITYRIGDRILQLKNRPEDDVYNGDVGILVEICKKDGINYTSDTLIIEFDEQLVEYTNKDFITFTHAYCMSVHKAQGNEFKIVIVTVLNEHYIMLKRNLFYTAITRAKEKLFVLGQGEAITRSIQNKFDYQRKTTLAMRFNKNSLYDYE